MQERSWVFSSLQLFLQNIFVQTFDFLNSSKFTFYFSVLKCSQNTSLNTYTGLSASFAIYVPSFTTLFVFQNVLSFSRSFVLECSPNFCKIFCSRLFDFFDPLGELLLFSWELKNSSLNTYTGLFASLSDVVPSFAGPHAFQNTFEVPVRSWMLFCSLLFLQNILFRLFDFFDPLGELLLFS